MKFLTTILSLYILLLSVQPALFSFPQPKEKKVMACCVKHKGNSHNSCPTQNKKDCCDNGKCNPFFSQCPMCAIVAVTGHQFPVLHFPKVYNPKQQYFSYAQHMLGSYQSEMLRPPCTV